jgi:hypothetical protein
MGSLFTSICPSLVRLSQLASFEDFYDHIRLHWPLKMATFDQFGFTYLTAFFFLTQIPDGFIFLEYCECIEIYQNSEKLDNSTLPVFCLRQFLLD